MKLKFYHRHPVLIGCTLIFLFLFTSFWLIMNLVQHEKDRDYSSWQITLGVMADNKTNAVNQWLNKQFAVLNKLAKNGSIQLYSQQLQRKITAKNSTEPAQISYLRNLLQVTASQNGFLDNDPIMVPIPANLAKVANNGLVLLNTAGEIITATAGINIPTGKLKDTIIQVIKTGKPTIFDLHINNNNRPQLGFIVPVYALQVQTGKRAAIAALYGFKDTTNNLFALLKSTNKTTLSTETILVRQEAETVRYLTPLADATPALTRQLPLNNNNLAAAYAIKHPGSFTEMHDYAGQNVLFTSRKINGIPWLIVQKIEADEALNETNRNRQFLLLSLGLTTMIITLLFIVAWWYGSSVRAKKTAHELLIKSGELETKTRLLDAINNNIEDFVFVTDLKNRLIFVNHSLANQFNTTPEPLLGKSITNIFGPTTAKGFLSLIDQSIKAEATTREELTIDINEVSLTIHTTITPLPDKITGQSAVLITCHDVTKLQASQKAQEALMTQLIKAMMRAIDLHDPYSANHSSKTAAIAKIIGQELDLNQIELQTLETAANLCNIGKIFLPKELLTKTAPLAKDEEETLKHETEYAAKILSGIKFPGPVLETIAQKHEHVDGSGYPSGLINESIITTSKILAVANAFVAMISPRAYRTGLSEKQAMEQILKKADQQFDRKAIAALFHVVENKIDRGN